MFTKLIYSIFDSIAGRKIGPLHRDLRRDGVELPSLWFIINHHRCDDYLMRARVDIAYENQKQFIPANYLFVFVSVAGDLLKFISNLIC